MPIYEYKCRKCDKVFEEFQSIHDKPLKYCSICKGRLQKVFSAVGISFKGSGFYSNDSKKSKTPVAQTQAKKEIKSVAKPSVPAAKA